MVDLIYGRGVTDLIRELPFYLTFFAILLILKSFIKKEHYTAQPISSIYATCIVLTVIGGSIERMKIMN